MSPLPVGDCVPSVSEERTLRRMDYEGEYIALSPLDPEKDAPGLFACSHGTELVEQLWTYMAYGPFEDVSVMQEWLEEIEGSEDPLFLSVRDRVSDRPIGMVSFLNIAPDARRLELGNIWYGPEAQNTCANTEAAYLMLCEAFDESIKVDILGKLMILGGLEYDPTLINRILLQEGLMDAIMRESSFAQYIKQLGIEQGIGQGIEQGIEQGERKSTIGAILEVLEIRFDLSEAHPLSARIAAIDDLQGLKQLHRAAIQVPSLEAFQNALDA